MRSVQDRTGNRPPAALASSETQSLTGSPGVDPIGNIFPTSLSARDTQAVLAGHPASLGSTPGPCTQRTQLRGVTPDADPDGPDR